MSRPLFGNDMQRERRRQLLLMERVGRVAERRLRKEITRASMQMLKEWEQTGNVKESAEHGKNIYSQLVSVWATMTRIMGNRVLQQGKSAGLVTERKQEEQEEMFDWFDLFMQEFIAEKGGEKIAEDIAETTRNQIKKLIELGRVEGLGQQGIAKKIREQVPTMSRYRAGVIARTETHTAANYAAQESAKRLSLPMTKQWIAADQPGRTRESHLEAGKKKPIGMDDLFDVGGEKLRFPGDPRGDAKETVNCRCVVGYIVED